VAIIATLAVLVGLGGGWLLATAFRSPAQQEAQATPPPPAPVVAEVESGDLADTVSFNAVVGRSSRQELAVAAAGLVVVTAQPTAVGAEITAGSVLLETNGRPLFALPGAFPFYRDMAQGDTGPDVSQLQSGLAAAGFAVTVDGRFGSTTMSALKKLYARAGYSPPSAALAAELAAVSSLPAFLVSGPRVSETISTETRLVLEQGALAATSSLPAGLVARLEPGMSAEIRVDGTSIAATIQTIGEPDPGTAESLVAVGSDEISPDVLGKDVLVVVTIELVAEDSLIVPSRALTPAGNGPPTVLRQRGDGPLEVVPVREVAQLSGLSAIEPIEAGALRAGDLVQVG
jgi:peptidoglycan hydrolase-like protein with peptidoglycan-binding domain